MPRINTQLKFGFAPIRVAASFRHSFMCFTQCEKGLAVHCLALLALSREWDVDFLRRVALARDSQVRECQTQCEHTVTKRFISRALNRGDIDDVAALLRPGN
jgi:hypothetical protein